MQQTTRLLEVRLHSPADVKVIKELGYARHVVYLHGIAYVCESNGIHIVPISGRVTPLEKKLNKQELVKVLEEWQLSKEGTVAQLRQRIQKHIKKLNDTYQKDKVDTSKVILTEAVETSCICRMTDSMLTCASDTAKRFYSIELRSDGAAVHGMVTQLCPYPVECFKVQSMDIRDSTLFVSYKGNENIGQMGGLMSVDLLSRQISVLLQNGTESCSECTGVSARPNSVLFLDTKSFQVKILHHDGQVEVLAGTGVEGNKEGRAELSSFGQLMGICCEYDKNIFITDCQTGCVKLITTIAGTIRFLEELGKLYEAFSVHLQHQQVSRLTVPDARRKVEDMKIFLEGAVNSVHKIIDSKKATNGPDGTVSNQTLKSVQMIYSQLGKLDSTIKSINDNLQVEQHK